MTLAMTSGDISLVTLSNADRAEQTIREISVTSLRRGRKPVLTEVPQLRALVVNITLQVLNSICVRVDQPKKVTRHGGIFP